MRGPGSCQNWKSLRGLLPYQVSSLADLAADAIERRAAASDTLREGAAPPLLHESDDSASDEEEDAPAAE
jgi:hypothetical protein